MALPERVRIKLSSEVAEAISITPVVVQEIAIRDLIEHMLGVIGKDEARVTEILLRGTLVSGASRFRWVGWEADHPSVRAILATFPDPDPTRTFDPALCVRAVLRGASRAIELPREIAAKKPFLRRSSFWDVLMEAARSQTAQYVGYSYRERADAYAVPVTAGLLQHLRNGARLITYSTLRDQIRVVNLETMDLFVIR